MKLRLALQAVARAQTDAAALKLELDRLRRLHSETVASMRTE